MAYRQWMQHDRHGRMECYTPAQVENNVAHGWRKCGPPGVANLLTAAPEEDTVEKVRERLDAAGIDYDRRWGLKRLLEAENGDSA